MCALLFNFSHRKMLMACESFKNVSRIKFLQKKQLTLAKMTHIHSAHILLRILFCFAKSQWDLIEHVQIKYCSFFLKFSNDFPPQLQKTFKFLL